MIGPVVVILDALDECGSPANSSRRALLRLLAEEFPKLPSNFRFIITSRQESDMEDAFSKKAHVLPVKLEHESEASRRDVSAFIVNEMTELFKRRGTQPVPNDWPWKDKIRFLGEIAHGLFIWASTVCRFVEQSKLAEFETLDKLIEDIQTHGHAEFGISALYATVLKSTQIPWEREDVRSRFQKVLYLILEAGITLTTDDIDGILGLPPHNSSALIISQLQSVLAYTPGSASRIRPLHASFAEFLKSEGQSGKPWNINIIASCEHIAKRCHESFDRMDRLLHFNICGIKTSFTWNDCIPDLQAHSHKVPIYPIHTAV